VILVAFCSNFCLYGLFWNTKARKDGSLEQQDHQAHKEKIPVPSPALGGIKIQVNHQLRWLIVLAAMPRCGLLFRKRSPILQFANRQIRPIQG
jgi:hypothetical protein